MKSMPLKRNLTEIASHTYDLLVVGGGIFGACAAWEAAASGLSVVLLEKQDFSHSTSANHFKMVHGGIRYLQHGDIYRIHESSHERSALLRICPHLVHPLPIVIPTYGYGVKGKAFLGAGMTVYDLLTFQRNTGLQSSRRIPQSRFLSRGELLRHFPSLNSTGLTGGAVFCDGQMYNPPRLALAFIRSAVNRGAHVANYSEVTDFVMSGNKVVGAKVKDVFSKDTFEIRARMTLNTAGPWAHRLLESTLGIALNPRPTFSRDLAFVVKRRFDSPYGLALSSDNKDADSIVDRGGRHLFLVPWRDYTLVGVWHKVFNKPPDALTIDNEALEAYTTEVNQAYPDLDLSVDDILTVNMGLTLFGDEQDQKAGELSFGKRTQIIDHQKEHNISRLITSIGVRATTARGVAEKVNRIIIKRLGRKVRRSDTHKQAIFGGDIPDIERFQDQATRTLCNDLHRDSIVPLIRNHGSNYLKVLDCVRDNPELKKPFMKSTVIKAEAVHAIREEMALKLADIVFRRTDLGVGSRPDPTALQDCAEIAAAEFKWDDHRIKIELDEVDEVLKRFRMN